jgi:hypothetical protein
MTTIIDFSFFDFSSAENAKLKQTTDKSKKINAL